jgi:hypothetical protein
MRVHRRLKENGVSKPLKGRPNHPVAVLILAF